MKINVKYFAAMREIANKSEELVETNATNATELYAELSERYQFNLGLDHLKVAINEEYMPFDTKLAELDTIVFIPPVAGG